MKGVFTSFVLCVIVFITFLLLKCGILDRSPSPDERPTEKRFFVSQCDPLLTERFTF